MSDVQSRDMTFPSDFSLQLEAFICRLQGFADLEADWDSYGADRISPMAIRLSTQFLHDLVSRETGRPLEWLEPDDGVPLHDGGIRLVWRKHDRTVEIDFGPNGKVGYLLVTGQKPDWVFEEHEVSTSSDALQAVTRTLIRVSNS